MSDLCELFETANLSDSLYDEFCDEIITDDTIQIMDNNYYMSFRLAGTY